MFKDLALPLIAKGVRVIPVQPLAKHTYLTGDHYSRGTLDPKQVLESETVSDGFMNELEKLQARATETINAKRIRKYRATTKGKRATLISIHRHSARRRGIVDMLSDDDLVRLGSQACHYCGHAGIETRLGFNGIDRRDNQVGYIIDNCVPCCKTCNQAKRDMPFSEWLAWLERIAAIRRTHESNDSANSEMPSGRFDM